MNPPGQALSSSQPRLPRMRITVEWCGCWSRAFATSRTQRLTARFAVS